MARPAPPLGWDLHRACALSVLVEHALAGRRPGLRRRLRHRVPARREPAEPLPRPPPKPRTHKQIFSDGWWGPGPGPLAPAQPPAAPTPRAPTHFFEGSRGAIQRPDPAALARLAAARMAAEQQQRPGGGPPRAPRSLFASPRFGWRLRPILPRVPAS